MVYLISKVFEFSSSMGYPVIQSGSVKTSSGSFVFANFRTFVVYLSLPLRHKKMAPGLWSQFKELCESHAFVIEVHI